MAEPLVSDALWALTAPLLPTRPPRPKGGRPPLDDRKALEGIVFVLRSGIPWAMLPQEMGCGSGMTCWRRLRDWQAAGVFGRLHRALLDRLGAANAVDVGRCPLDSASFPAKKGASSPARTRPTGASRAASATSWSTPAASRSRSCSAPRTPTTAGSSSPCSTPCRQSGSAPAGRAGARASCTPTRPTITTAAAAPATSAASSRASPAGGSRAASAWAGTGGWWSARWPGSPVSAGSPFATSAGSTSWKASTGSPPA
jgi:transposase